MVIGMVGVGVSPGLAVAPVSEIARLPGEEEEEGARPFEMIS